jgi:transmembrane sensor
LIWFFGAPQEETRIAAQDNSVRVVELADGSVVRLMDGASIGFDEPFERQLRLRGRAFFDVSHGDAPFSVFSESAIVSVLGTRFGVDASPSSTEVTLVEGRVAVSSAHDRTRMVVLEPGQQTRVDGGAAPREAVTVDLFRALDWTDLLVFRATAMSQVAELLEDAFGVRIFVHRSLADERVTGTFEESSSARDIINALAATLDARVEVGVDGDFRILPR